TRTRSSARAASSSSPRDATPCITATCWNVLRPSPGQGRPLDRSPLDGRRPATRVRRSTEPLRLASLQSLTVRSGAGVRDLARGEREGRRRLQQLNSRVELDEARATQLAARHEQIGERTEPQAIRPERILVREL